MSEHDKTFLYVGCGNHRIKNFVHMEISLGKDKSGVPDICGDIAEHIPYKDGAVDFVYSRETLEHLTYRELENHFLETSRILKPGTGIVRLVVPHFEHMMKEYNRKVWFPHKEYRKGRLRDLPIEDYTEYFIYRMIYRYHFYLHNIDTLTKLLKRSGFVNIRQCLPGDTAVKEVKDEIFDAEIARHNTIIIEAVRGLESPVIKPNDLIEYPRNPIKKFLAKYFNIKISAFEPKKPFFPQPLYFKTLFFQKSNNIQDLKPQPVPESQQPKNVKYVNDIQLATAEEAESNQYIEKEVSHG